ncbi:hypothetical protein BHU72_12395 [Desulfuribacillus stibiiarsenatis]|uniref:precorrin-2 dehydrogenase n=1 Tax=Desulfuribacillus stibiiarsenatis TaxID=1390249 RepID=A0A1E5L241_9FIRM|nr:bifunctional precorrin-2 dehydrogenase/sirohydrochlorin ferrochelatase [Desulfuribacillus stibiiarsenatis]OEH84197.1 hypothetical protein BHU72_12395 [Desulfuribacillus stibiiarsenatis]
MERYYPVFLRVQDRLCVVVGGGNVAERKVKSLLQDGASIRVISPQVTDTLQHLAKNNSIEFVQRPFQCGDLADAFLAYAATNSKQVNEQVYEDAKRYSVLVNMIDAPELCDFIVPSRVDRGRLQIAISTSGASPALTKHLRQELESYFGDEYDIFLDWMQQLRSWLLHNEPLEQRRRELFRQVIEMPVLQLLREKKIEEAKHIIHELIQQEIL